MRTLYSPLLGIEIVGTTAEVFRLAQGHAPICDSNHATRGIVRQTDCLAPQICNGSGIVDVNLRRTVILHLLQLQSMQYGRQLVERRILLSLPLSLLAHHCHKDALTTSHTGNKSIDRTVEPREQRPRDMPFILHIHGQ